MVPRRMRLYAERMTKAVDTLIQDALLLSANDRAELADRLVESLDPLTDEEIRQAWAAEAIKRRDEVRAGLIHTIPEDVVARRVRDLAHR